jgi:predicted ATP-dependent serine protease
VAEAARLGFGKVLVPPGGRALVERAAAGIRVTEVAHVGRALAALRMQVVRT